MSDPAGVPVSAAGASRRAPTTWTGLRAERGLSLRQLEARTGINRGTLSLIEAGRLIPTPDQAAAILEVLRRVG